MKLAYNLLYVPSVTAAVEFYEEAFGLKRRFIHESGTYAEMETGETTLGFVDAKFAAEGGIPFQAVTLKGQNPGFELGLVTDEVAVAYAHAVAAGCLPIIAPKQKPWGQAVSYVRDLNGFLVEICSPVKG